MNQRDKFEAEFKRFNDWCKPELSELSTIIERLKRRRVVFDTIIIDIPRNLRLKCEPITRPNGKPGWKWSMHREGTFLKNVFFFSESDFDYFDQMFMQKQLEAAP